MAAGSSEKTALSAYKTRIFWRTAMDYITRTGRRFAERARIYQDYTFESKMTSLLISPNSTAVQSRDDMPEGPSMLCLSIVGLANLLIFAALIYDISKRFLA